MRRGTGNLAAVGLTLCLLVFEAGCGARDDKQIREDGRERPAVAKRVTTPASPALPRRGRARVEFSQGRVTVVSNGAPRSRILEQLAEAAGFELDAATVDPRPLTVRIEDEELRDAVPLLLGNLPYQAGYSFDPALAAHVLTRLRVGEAARPDSAEASSHPPGPGAGAQTAERETVRAKSERLARRNDREREEFRADEDADFDSGVFRLNALDLAQARARQEGLLEALLSGDPLVRAVAASEVEPEERGLERLLALLENDPDPRVRTAAAARLEDSDGFAAVEGLIMALDDADREVVLQAIDSLEFAGDESVIPALQPLLDDPDRTIGAAAAEAIEFLKD